MKTEGSREKEPLHMKGMQWHKYYTYWLVTIFLRELMSHLIEDPLKRANATKVQRLEDMARISW